MKSIEMRSGVNELAIATGKPSFANTLHVGRPNVGSEDDFFKRLRGIMDRRWFTNLGPLVQEFEARLKEVLGVRHCIPICNATTALEIAIRATGMRGEVIVPSFTFVATVHALQWQGITPVFCDVKPDGHNLDPQLIEDLISPRTSGILGVHVWGKACDHATLGEIAKRRGLTLMYDASHAFGCSSEGTSIGNFGACEVFSFHATKFFNTFEGGAIATNDDELANRIRLMKNFGFTGVDQVRSIGTNGKMNEISAAMGLTGLESLSDFVEVNRRNYEIYREHVADMPGIRMIAFDERERNNYQYIVLEIEGENGGLNRDEVLALLEAENVLARRYFYPGCHNMEPYKTLYPKSRLRLPRTEALCSRVLVLPTGTAVTAESVRQVSDVIKTAASDPGGCRKWLKPRVSRAQAGGC